MGRKNKSKFKPEQQDDILTLPISPPMPPTTDCQKRQRKTTTTYDKLNILELTNENPEEAVKIYLEIPLEKQEKRSNEGAQHSLAILAKLKTLLSNPAFLFNPAFLLCSGYIACKNIYVVASAVISLTQHSSRESFQQVAQELEDGFSKVALLTSSTYLGFGLDFWTSRAQSQNTNNPSTEPTPSTPRLNPS